MIWFKHSTNSLHDIKIQLLRQKYGLEGYGLYFAVLEIIARRMDADNLEDWGYLDKFQSSEMIAQEVNIDVKICKEIIAFCIKIELFELRENRLFCKNILKRLDDYARKVEAKNPIKPDVTTMSGQKPANVRTKSGIDKIRREEIRKEEKRPAQSINFLKSIPIDDLNEMVSIFNCSSSMVRSKCEDLLKWCESKGKVYTNYKSLLFNTLKKDYGKRKVLENSTQFLDAITPDEPTEEVENIDPTPEQIAARERLAKMKEDLNLMNKTKMV